MKTCLYLWYLAESVLKWEMFGTDIVEKIKTHIFSSGNFFFLGNCAIYEIMFDKIVESSRPQMIYTGWFFR